ncbi:solute carrier organic anion transporter family member 2B1 [Scyliorhinus canicula]|uniref:solute carrier organic anion transporter family member 2B1 n=1 Tax=Scyliorhinus canicula TaxID=7830 RepID=UPI0018F6198E|nr:solute carrier organic anion transporter family member 2B1 [Scyliorhinus canicula]XP_038674779.1 solute carrier organic anion transporter family member 2B1 [Scyliorhinus canicula]
MGITTPPTSKPNSGEERPRRCRFNPFHSIKFFVLCHGLLQLSQLMVSGYMKSITSTIEKRFGLSSQTSGMLSSLNEIGSTVFIVFVSYFGSRVHRPRLIGCGGIIVSVAAFTMAMPHFIMGRYKFDTTTANSVGNVSDICHLAREDQKLNNNESCSMDNIGGDDQMLSLLIVGQLLLGIGGVPIQPFGISYVDDFASNRNSPLYLGILFAVSVLGPAFGFVLGSAVLRLYVDIDKTPADQVPLQFGNPRWVGAWWLGFLLAASCVLLVSIPYFFFPREMPKEKSEDPEGESKSEKEKLKSKQEDTAQDLSLLQFIKSFPCILLRTLRCSVYLLVVLAQVCMSFLMSGLTVFIGKFLEQQFSVTASFANLLIGSIHVPGAVLGILIGGAILRKFQITLRGSAVMCFMAIFVSICATTPLLFLGCSTQNIDGLTFNRSSSNGSSGIDVSCNRGCSCRDQAYNPVCTTDGIEFISPCHAGCKTAIFEFTGKVVNYTNCSCISTQALVKPGTCGSGCYRLLLPFMFFLTLAAFVATLCQTPSFMLVLRSVKPEDKSFAIGIQFMLFRVLAWLPGPILYGSTIDTTCIRWEKKCNKKAACRYYNLDLFRVRYIGLQMLFECGAFLFFLAAYYVLVKDLLRKEQQDGVKAKTSIDAEVGGERKILMEKGNGTTAQLELKV